MGKNLRFEIMFPLLALMVDDTGFICRSTWTSSSSIPEVHKRALTSLHETRGRRCRQDSKLEREEDSNTSISGREELATGKVLWVESVDLEIREIQRRGTSVFGSALRKVIRVGKQVFFDNRTSQIRRQRMSLKSWRGCWVFPLPWSLLDQEHYLLLQLPRTTLYDKGISLSRGLQETNGIESRWVIVLKT